MRTKKGNKMMKTGKRKINAKKIIQCCRTAAIMPGIAMLLVVPAYATDPVAAINNLSGLLFLILKALGVIFLALGVLNVALSLQSHDPSQRSQGFVSLVAGLLLCCVESIVNLLGF